MRPLNPFATVLVLLAFFVCAAAAEARTVPASDFGTAGKVGTIGGVPYPYGDDYAAVAGDGDIYVAAQSSGVLLQRYLPDGKIDPTFGDGGNVSAGELDGMSFRLGGLLVDAAGQPYLVGTTFADSTLPSYLVGTIAPPGYATVAHYTSTGALDPGFGNGGVARFDFGLPAPGVPYEKPTVYGSRAVLDSAGRIVLVASEDEFEARGGGHGAAYENAKLIARLTPTGRLDSSFGGDGTVAVPSIAVNGLGVDAEGGAELALGGAAGRTTTSFRLMRLLADGQPVAALSPVGVRSYSGIGAARALAVEAGGGGVVLGTSPVRSPHKGGTITPVMKIAATGAPAHGFGKRGTVRIHLPGHSYLSEVITDGSGGAYLVGARVTRPPHHTWQKPLRQGLVVHLEADGNLDPEFGDRGLLTIVSPAELLAHGASLTAGGKRLLAHGSAYMRRAGTYQFLAEYKLGGR